MSSPLKLTKTSYFIRGILSDICTDISPVNPETSKRSQRRRKKYFIWEAPEEEYAIESDHELYLARTCFDQQKNVTIKGAQYICYWKRTTSMYSNKKFYLIIRSFSISFFYAICLIQIENITVKQLLTSRMILPNWCFGIWGIRFITKAYMCKAITCRDLQFNVKLQN